MGLYFPPLLPGTTDDHFTAGPDRSVYRLRRGRVGGAGGCPIICAGIVSPAGVQRIETVGSAPDDHFAAGPDRRVIESGLRRVGRASSCPGVIDASVRNIRYSGKCIVRTPRSQNGSGLFVRSRFQGI